MTKKQLRQRLLDISNGAGMGWDEQAEYWDNFNGTSLCKFIAGVKASFNLDGNNYLVATFNLDNYDTLDEIVDFFWRNRGKLI